MPNPLKMGLTRKKKKKNLIQADDQSTNWSFIVQDQYLVIRLNEDISDRLIFVWKRVSH